MSNTVSVISGENNTKIKDIEFGKWSIRGNSMAINSNSNEVYVANKTFISIFVIGGETNTE
jgi:DNA-binding beta-propeller fold protein YncE